ncbi:hypothetical protein [Massilia terrae]|uniref:Uncharacterized protein n=1 Tax=Massilia terrae TaxID=1811224 RepID=A0ABT2D476_9BURK|nr:hypothetical protein [Massilia terrae]MCS0661046.1 hypothetical protein [Massilia terrae]
MRSKPKTLRAKLLLLAILPATVAHFIDKVQRYRQAYKAEIARHEATLVENASHLLAMSTDLARVALDGPGGKV